MDTLGIEPRASRMLSGCDTTTPCAPLLLNPGVAQFRLNACPKQPTMSLHEAVRAAIAVVQGSGEGGGGVHSLISSTRVTNVSPVVVFCAFCERLFRLLLLLDEAAQTANDQRVR